MKTKSLITPSAVSAAAIATLVVSKADKAKAEAMAERKLAAIEAYGIAILEGSDAALTEWTQYVIARAMGGTDAEILTGAKEAIRMAYVLNFTKADRKAKADEVRQFLKDGTDPHVKGFDVSECEDTERLATERTRQYRNRVNVLDDAGITLLGADGMPRTNVSDPMGRKGADGQVRKVSLSTAARTLQEQRAGKNRGTKARKADGVKAEGATAGATEGMEISSQVNPANVALSPELILRVLAFADSDTAEGKAIREAHAETFLHIAGAITLARITSKARPGKVLHAVPSMPSLSAIMPKRQRVPAGAKAKAKAKASERVAREASKASITTKARPGKVLQAERRAA